MKRVSRSWVQPASHHCRRCVSAPVREVLQKQ
jgi:hypothetical protein